MAFNLDYIKKISIDNINTVNKAINIAKDNISIKYVTAVDTAFTRKSYSSVKTLLDQNNVSLNFSVDRGVVLDCKCSCSRTVDKDNLCEHALASLFSILAINKENIDNDTLDYSEESKYKQSDKINTSRNLSVMLQQYTQQDIARDAAKQNTEGTIQLLPVLYNSGKSLFVTFKIGKTDGHKYILYDIEKFIDNCRMKKKYEYGKNFSFYHSESIFDGKSKIIVKWLIQNRHNLSFEGARFYYASNGMYRSIKLSGYLLDLFAKCIIGNTVEMDFYNVDKQSFNGLRDVQYKNNKYVMKISEISGGFTMEIPEIKLAFFGNSTVLILNQDGSLCISDSKFTKHAGMFIKALAYSSMRLTSSSIDMSKIISVIFPKLKPWILITSEDRKKLKNFMPLKINAELYFDKLNYGAFTLKIKYKYDNNTYDFRPNVEKDLSQPRDFLTEMHIEKIVSRYFPINEACDKTIIQPDEEKQYKLITEGIDILSKYAHINVSDSFAGASVYRGDNAKLGVSLSGDLLKLDLDFDEFDKDELKNIYDSFIKKKQFHKLSNGTFVDLNNGTIAETVNIFSKLGLSSMDLRHKNISVAKYKALYLNSMLEEMENLRYTSNDSFKKAVNEIENISEEEIKLPSNLKCNLRHYQKYGFEWLAKLALYGFGGILADDMGLGKTLQVLSLVQYTKENAQTISKSKTNTSLVVCPSSLVLNWMSEAQKFTPDLKVLCISGTANYREELLNTIYDYDLIITSYELIKRDITLYLDKKLLYIFADEAQYMKNNNSKNARSMKSIKAASKFALTGTPVENSLSELWSIFDFLMPGYLFKYSKFKRTFEVPIVKDNNKEAEKELQKMIAPFVLRRLKKDVLKELPKKSETVLFTEMDEEQKKLYAAFAQNAKEQIESDREKGDSIKILSMLMRLRQICCDPALVNSDLGFETNSAKKDLCFELIQESIESGHRILLFSQFTSMLDILKDLLDKNNIKYMSLTGSTKTDERLNLVQKFNTGDVPVFLISLKAGGTGLNLTGADIVIHYDPWWNSSAQSQATDRAYRIGQERSVQVYKLIVKNTIEEKILELQNKKAKIADSILSSTGDSLSKLTHDELLALLG